VVGDPGSGRRTGRFAYNPWVLARAAAALDRAALKPASLPNDLITGLALAPPVIAGLIIFKVPALEMLAVALATGVAGQVVAQLLWRKQLPRTQASPLIAALFGVALTGAGAGLITSLEIATLAVVLELLRARYIPAIRAQAGLLAYAAIALIARGAPFAYIRPADGTSFPDPINVWYHYFSPTAAAFDPIALYVGNVPGPVFATSLLAVAIGAAWFAYAGRVSLAALVAFLLGALLPIYIFHWDFIFQLDSGPTWFAAALLLADRRLLPGSWAIRPVLGFGAGFLAVGLRRNGYGIEAAFITVAGVQAVMAVFVLVFWGGTMLSARWKRTRRLRQREANLRVVKSVPKAS
jgi:Na+-transporting NADH:ubiquinone oxidoreductase subunit NqrB